MTKMVVYRMAKMVDYLTLARRLMMLRWLTLESVWLTMVVMENQLAKCFPKVSYGSINCYWLTMVLVDYRDYRHLCILNN